MRESIGGSMIFWIVLFLFSIFIAFLSFIIKYARVYKIKNTIINYITRYEGEVKHSDIDKQLLSMKYQENGRYVVCRYFPSEMGMFYYIELYSNTEFPIVGAWLHHTVHIKGETKIFDVNDKNVDLNQSSSGALENDNVWFYGNEDQCYLCVLGDRCRSIEVE